jgi:hypothetical protein
MFSRRFSQVIYLEREPEIYEAACHNYLVLGLENIQCFNRSAEAFLQEPNGGFDLIYLDPARRDASKGKVFQFKDCSPNVLAIKDLVFSISKKILIKTAPFLDIKAGIKELQQVQKVWVLEHEGECREVLYLLGPVSIPEGEIPISAVVLTGEGAPHQTFEFNYEEESQTKVEYAPPLAYLYEPGPAVLKAGAFKTFAAQNGLYKLHPHSHLYTSENLVAGLPARSFSLQFTCKYEANAVAALLPEKKANVSVRNFPVPAEAVKKKLKLSDGGQVYLFATTDYQDNKILVGCLKN